jgi:glyoxylase-like metal-dependent hydrolase (beta-lactamase superfamily II)
MPLQHQAITGLNAPIEAQVNNTADLRIYTVASPLPDAINMHLVETPRGLLLFDALRRSIQVADVIKVIQRLKKPPLALFLTHAHTDHYGGIFFLRQRFPALPIYATPAVLKAMRDDPNGDNKRRRALLGEQFPTQAQINANLPNRLIQSEVPFEIGGLRIKPIILGPSESPAATVYLLPQLNAAISGDLINVLTVPAPVESLASWLVQLNQIEAALRPDALLYVGHGPSGPARPLIREQRAYLMQLRDKIKAALSTDQTVTRDELEAIVLDMRLSFPHYRGAAFLPPDELSRRSVGWVTRQMGGKLAPDALQPLE